MTVKRWDFILAVRRWDLTSLTVKRWDFILAVRCWDFILARWDFILAVRCWDFILAGIDGAVSSSQFVSTYASLTQGLRHGDCE